MSTLIGSVGADWIRKNGLKSANDDLLRTWRDFLENRLQSELGLDVDLALGERTRFQFLGGSETHTVIEIESFARKALDAFLNRSGSVPPSPPAHSRRP
jgi:hypothetical protein